MNIKRLIVGLAAVLLIALAAPVAFADTTGTSTDVQTSAKVLTQDQINQVKPLFDKMLALKKELMQKYVDMGVISQSDADARIKAIQDRQNYCSQNGIVPGSGQGCGRLGGGYANGGCGGNGSGCGGGGGGCGMYNAAPSSSDTPDAPTSTNQLKKNKPHILF